MLELAAALLPRLDAGHRLAVATVTRINGSAPRTLGTAMALDDDGAVIGSISGGCVEGAVYEACQEVLRTGEPSRQEFGYSDDDAFAVGLACGGRIEVVVQRLAPGDGWSASRLRSEFVAAAAGLPAGVALIVGAQAFGVALAAGDDVGPAGVSSAGVSPADLSPADVSQADVTRVGRIGADSVRRLQAELAARISSGRGGLAVVHCEDGPVEALFVVSASSPRMIIFGAVTSLRPWPAHRRFWATASPSAMPARCSQRPNGFPRQTR